MPVLIAKLEALPPVDLDFRLDTDATLPSLHVQVFDQGEPVDLTGGTALFSMEDLAGTPKITGAAAVIEDALKGLIRYDWDAADVDTTGIFVGQFQVTIGANKYLQPNNASERLRILIGPVDAPSALPLPSTILHAPNHIRSGSDIIDADRLVISWDPTNYIPDASPSEAGDVDDLTAHLKGIDNLLTTVGSVPTSTNKNMAASITTADGQKATGTAVALTPASDGHIEVFVNGVSCPVGDGTKSGVPAYFSGDNGVTARPLADVVAGDFAHWNGSVAEFELAGPDRVSFNYNV